MRNAEARAEHALTGRTDMENLLIELSHLHRTLGLESYLKVVDDLTDQARKDLQGIRDPNQRERARQEYRQVIEFAVNLACGISS